VNLRHTMTSESKRPRASHRAGDSAAPVPASRRTEPQRPRVRVRRVQPSDFTGLWRWRNHPDVRRWFFDSERIPLKEHLEWCHRTIHAKKTLWLVGLDSRSKMIGQIRFETPSQGTSRVSVNLNPSCFGKGLGSQLITAGTRRFFEEFPRVKKVEAEVIAGNIASAKAFQNSSYRFARRTIRHGKEVILYVHGR